MKTKKTELIVAITPANSKTAKFTTSRCTEPCTRSFDEIFFQIELVWSNFHQRLTACFSYIFFTKGRNYTYISITLDVHFSWYTFPMRPHNELKFLLKDYFNYRNTADELHTKNATWRKLSWKRRYIKLRYSEKAT
jgi:hypothetical protein